MIQFFHEIKANFVKITATWNWLVHELSKCDLECHVHCPRSWFFGFNTILYSCRAIWAKKDCNYNFFLVCACVFVRERECVCDFSFLFFYGHFWPKHLWTTGDNLNASYIRRIIIHPSTIIFFIDKEDLPRGRCGGGYEEGNETVSRGNPITEIDLFILQTPVFYCKIYYT